jgi:hypothetical protein
MSSKDEDLEKAKFFYELALKSGEYIQRANERLTDKVRWFTASASTLIPLTLGVGYYILQQPANYWIFPVFSLSLVSLVSATILGMIVQRPTNSWVFDAQTFLTKFNKKNQTFIVNKSAATMSDISALNLKTINSKENYLYCMIALICFALFLLIITFLALGIVSIPQH